MGKIQGFAFYGRRARSIRRLQTARRRDRQFDGRPEHIEVLSRSVLRRRSVEVFPSGYATLLSIVQGIALGTLAVSVLNYVARGAETSAIFVIAEALLTLVALIVVFYHYVWFLLIFRWAPGPLDTIIPFSLGASEVAVAATVGFDFAWCVAFGVLHLLGGLAFWHTLQRDSPAIFESIATFKRVRRLLIALVWMSFLGVPVAVLAAVGVARWSPMAALFFAGAFLIIAIVMLVMSERVLKGIFAEHGLVRLPLFNT